MVQCSAKSKRSGIQCLRWAVRGRNTCHMHGGKSKGAKTKQGKENSRLAVLKHGGYTKEVLEEHRQSMELICKSKNLLKSLA